MLHYNGSDNNGPDISYSAGLDGFVGYEKSCTRHASFMA